MCEPNFCEDVRVEKISGRGSALAHVSGSVRRRLGCLPRGRRPTSGGRRPPKLAAPLCLREDISTMVSKNCSASAVDESFRRNELRGHQLPAWPANTMLALLAWARARPLSVSGASPRVAMTPCVVSAPPSARYQLPTHICLQTPRGVRDGKIPHFHQPTHTAARRCLPFVDLFAAAARPPRIASIPSTTAHDHTSVGDRHRRRRRRDPEVRQLQAQEGR